MHIAHSFAPLIISCMTEALLLPMRPPRSSFFSYLYVEDIVSSSFCPLDTLCPTLCSCIQSQVLLLIRVVRAAAAAHTQTNF